MLKRFFNFSLYSLTALIACFFSLILVLHFFNPVFASASNSDQEKITLKKIFSDIFSNLKVVFKMSEKEDSKESNSSSSNPSPPPDSFEGSLENLEVPNNEASTQQNNLDNLGEYETPSGELPPQPTGNAGAPSEEIGDTISLEKPIQVNEQKDSQQSEVSLQIQSDMAPFIYQRSDSRSPFDDPTRKDPNEGEVKIIIPKTPPEMYDLSEIKLKGIIWNIKNPKALFELPGGEGHYTLIKGDKVGKNGLIFEIREDEVVIVETFYKDVDATERVIKLKKMDRLRLNAVKK